MRWDRLFEDLEDQLASEWEAERIALDTEAERLRLSRIALRGRIDALREREVSTPAPTWEVSDGSIMKGEVVAVGADWVALALALETRREVVILLPFSAIVSVGMPHADVLRTARTPSTTSDLAARMSLGFVVRDLVRRRVAVAVSLGPARILTGTIDRAGADHLDLAVHDRGAARRASAVSGHRLIPFAAICSIRLEGTSVAV